MIGRVTNVLSRSVVARTSSRCASIFAVIATNESAVATTRRFATSVLRFGTPNLQSPPCSSFFGSFLANSSNSSSNSIRTSNCHYMLTISRARSAFKIINKKRRLKGTTKTKQAAAKRFIKTSSGLLKYRRPGGSHLNVHKSSDRKGRLAQKAILRGTYAKRMNNLLLGKGRK